jgi:hypothetical protein
MERSMHPPFRGGCQCGAVRYQVTSEATVVYACHCTFCQSQSGSAFGMAMRVPAEHFHLTQGKLKSFEREAESGQVFTNSFCSDCGTRIHHQADKSRHQISLKPGTLDDTSWLDPTHHLFTGSRQPWVIIPPNAESSKTMPVDRSWLAGKQK